MRTGLQKNVGQTVVMCWVILPIVLIFFPRTLEFRRINCEFRTNWIECSMILCSKRVCGESCLSFDSINKLNIAVSVNHSRNIRTSWDAWFRRNAVLWWWFKINKSIRYWQEKAWKWDLPQNIFAPIRLVECAARSDRTNRQTCEGSSRYKERYVPNQLAVLCWQ